MHRPSFTALLAVALLLAQSTGARAGDDDQLARSLAGHVSFLASDALGGRDTGSAGFDVAAEYVASQFRRAGLEAPVDGTYFQSFDWSRTAREKSTMRCTLDLAGRQVAMAPQAMSVEVDHHAAFAGATLVKAGMDDGEFPVVDVDGPIVVVTEMPRLRTVFRDRRRAGDLMRFVNWIADMPAAMLVVVDRDPATEERRRPAFNRPGETQERRAPTSFPIVRLHDEDVAAWYDEQPKGATDGTIDLDMGEERAVPMIMRNVVGVVRGADPARADEWVLVTAHLDHIGTGTGSGDVINNGANDDASGVAGVIEVAAALAEDPPARSVLFITFFGEERGLLGSHAYVDAPLVPLEKTIANVNLEHIGRTDDSDEPGSGQFMVTGYRLSTAADVLIDAGKAAGLKHNPHDRKSRQFFGASDNVSFARVGIPAHTLCTCFIFPDYHGPGDHWDRLDYANMSRVVGAVVDGVRRLADVETPPKWHDTRDAERYREARK